MIARILHGDAIEQLRTLVDESVDACVTDPPYGLSFMGQKWDHQVPSVELWREVLRVLKPGAHLLSFFGSRTYHRGVVAIEDAGFEIRDQIMWVYGSGFPKSLDVSKAIDKAAGAERNIIGMKARTGGGRAAPSHEGWQRPWMQEEGALDRPFQITAPATDAARQWAGWGTALKPAHEPIVVARKPLIGTVAANVLAHGTGAMNIDACRVPHDEQCRMMAPSQANIDSPSDKCRQAGRRAAVLELKSEGRWPANLIHDGSDEVIAGFPETYGDSGSAARFFYCAKASKEDRVAGNTHPTVKPTDLMRYLCRLVTPPGGTVLDPFCGSGSTGRAALQDGFKFIGIERDADYAGLAEARNRGITLGLSLA